MSWEGTSAVDYKSMVMIEQTEQHGESGVAAHVLCPDGDVFIRQYGQVNLVFHHRLGL